MATDVERLIVSLEASTAKYERALNKANQQTEKQVKQMQSRFDSLGGSVSRMERGVAGSLGNVGRAFGVLGIALTTTSIIAMTSAWTDLNSRINNAAGGVERGAAVLDQLSVMARRTYSSLNQTAEGYLQNQQALSALGYSTQQQLDLVEAMNNALVIGAVRGQTAESVTDAWAKAMASGSLRGENLNTVIQKGGRLSKALADSMGISVNELRKWGEQGKITTDVMFGLTNQQQILRDEAAAMPATVSDGFVLLRDSVFKFVGEADSAAGSSAALAEAILALANAIDQMPEQGWFDKFIQGEVDAFIKGIATTEKEIKSLGLAFEWLNNTRTDEFFAGLFDPSQVSEFVSASEQALSQVEDSWRRVANEAYNATSGDVKARIDEITGGIVSETLAADEAAKQLAQLASSYPEAEPFLSTLLAWTDSLYAVRDGALAAAQGMSQIGSFPSMRQLGKTFGPDLSNDGAPGGPIRPPSSGGKKGGGGKSPAAKFDEDLKQWQQKITMLERETALQSALNPLIDDHGFAVERLRVQMDLENAATKAGLALTPDRQAAIAALADGYATAKVEADKLKESQDAVRDAAKDLQDATQAATKSFITDLIEGKSATEALGNALSELANKLISMGLDTILKNVFRAVGGGGGFNVLSIFGIGKRERGGPVSAGQPYIVGEKRPELFVPTQSGMIVPRVPTMPAANDNSGGGGQVSVAVSVGVDDSGNLMPFVTRVSGQMAGQAIKANNKQLPSLMRDMNQRMG